MAPSTDSSGRVNARKLVEEIADEHGYLGEDVYDAMDPMIQRKVQKAMQRKDVLIGSNVLTLAKNLYNSSARFVFELLQNADDNSYTKARASFTAPYVSFHVYRERIVVEYNEDGFTHDDLIAICSIGRSSKSNAHGYTGEKGIGFKSVFMVAWKALIQSGDFSFYFQHKKGDSGMGMISPTWEDIDETIAGPLTRITLFLHDSLSDDAMETIFSQFKEIDPVMLLFLRNLEKIDVTMYDDEEEEYLFTTYSTSHHEENRVHLDIGRLEEGEVELYSKAYFFIKHLAKDLPKNENKSYSDSEISRRTYETAEVILAFPLDDNNVPIIEAQQLFAFLPIKTEGFSFLIQADFVTEASRQDIVMTSPRNKRLLDDIAEAFVKAALQFCTHPTLRFQWMRYLPKFGDYPWTEFWRSLLEKIKPLLKKESLLLTRSHKEFRPIKVMRRLKYDMLDKQGDPLLPDSTLERYLATEYTASDLDMLKDHGLSEMTMEEFLDKVELDLDNGVSSRIKSSDIDEEWHSRLAKYLVSAFSKYPERIGDLALIPITGGRWTSTQQTRVYYPHVKSYKIPTDLSLEIVDPKAEMNSQRKELFNLLGVETYEAPSIRAKIFDQYDPDNVTVRDLATSRSHLIFLYLTAHLDTDKDEIENYRTMHVLDHECRVKVPHSDNVYFRDESPYGAQELFRSYETDDLEAPGLDVSFLHETYTQDPPERPKNETRTWKTWLKERENIRSLIPLFQTYQKKTYTSRECRYVAEDRPEMFLGFLLANWEGDGARIINSDLLRSEILQIEVLCEGGRKHPLGDTYLPIAEHEYARMFLSHDDFFPWIHIEDSLKDDTKIFGLQMLAKKLGFAYPNSELEFYCTILRFIYLSNEDAMKLEKPNRVFDLYKRIVTRCIESVTQEMSREIIQEAFEFPLIYVPKYGSKDACWAEPAECLWEAPEDMTSFCSLKLRYKDIKDGSYCETLFHDILEIRDVTVEDLTMELFNLREDWCTDFDRISTIYNKLKTMRPELDSSQTETVRESFQQDSLIFVTADWDGDTNWLSTSECLWSTATKINAKATLNDQYEDFFDFFVTFLGVKTLTLEMVVDKLIEQEEEEASIEEIKGTIWVINDFLQSDKEHPDADKILEGNLFPIRYPDGTVELCSSDIDFAIADREHLLGLFSGKCKILDFDVNETIRLGPFLKWTGLEERCLSLSTKEISALSDDSEKRLDSIDRDLARKAYGLLRVAVHFGSPRVRAGESYFYEELKKIEVRETDGISSELHLSQDGKAIIVKMNTSELHLQDHEDGLRIYVLRDEELQHLCFLDRIPKALFQWIMTSPSTGICEDLDDKAINVMQKILQATTKQVSLILERAGIVSIETPDDSMVNQTDVTTPIILPTIEGDSVSTHAESDSDWERNTLVQDAQSTIEQENLPERSNMVDIIYTSARAAHRSSTVTNPITVNPRREVRGPHMSLTPGPSQDENIDLEYLNILRSVVSHARRAVFPSQGAFDMRNLARSLETDDPDASSNYSGLRSSATFERDKKIGAAGELFIFEVLSSLDPSLPNFSRNNWQSNMRKYVTIHEDYGDLRPWSGPETADITYSDHNGVLTNFLVDKGYLNAAQWSDKRPHYFLEVKSTTGTCESRFFMSKHQYRRMRTCSNGPTGSEQTNEIYVILRVFNLGKDSINMKVYMDPQVMKERNELLFTAENWSIIPATTNQS